MPAFGVRLYRLLHGRAEDGSLPGWPPRPEGRVMWLHAPSLAAARGFAPLIAAIRSRGAPETRTAFVIVTCPEPFDLPGALVIPPPPETAEGTSAFLSHWRPELGIWAEGALRPALLQLAASRGVAMILVEGLSPGLKGARWWPRLMPGVVSVFRHAFVRDDHAKRLWSRAGIAVSRISVTGPLEEPSHVLPVNEPERAALARVLGTRPVWLATGLPEAEDDLIAEAHLGALRIAHRLLLILVPDNPSRLDGVAARLREKGLCVACRAQDEDPDEEVQVYLADAEELGLWYRLAPITYCGGTLSGPGAARHPFEAAAVGSAILHGPQTGTAAPAFERLLQSGASRMVVAGADLGEAVGDLLAADRAARLAQAAWGVTSGGGEATALAATLAVDILEGRQQ